MLAQVYSTCGRYVLEVAGIVVAMQGDKSRYNGFPEEVLPPIPAEELERATIGGKPCKDLPLDVVRFFRGDCWTEEMLRYAAEQINATCDREKEEFLEGIRNQLRDRNPEGKTIVDFLICWEEQATARAKTAEARVRELEARGRG